MIEKKIDRTLNVSDNGCIRVQTVEIVLENGTEIARTSPHSKSLCPGQDISQESPRVQAVADAVWTQEVIDAYRASLSV